MWEDKIEKPAGLQMAPSEYDLYRRLIFYLFQMGFTAEANLFFI